jgi:ribosomal protein S18 acetylase RimI-like enzyme
VTIRPATDLDRDAVCALGVVEELAWFGRAEVSADEVGEWVDEEGGVSQGVVAVDDAGRVRGFASPGRYRAVFIVDPVHTDGVAGELLPWLDGQSDAIEVMTFAGDAARIAAFERHGMRHRRSSFVLARPASAGPVPVAAFPDDIEVARYRPGEDDVEAHRLIYVDAAWASVDGHADRDLAAWKETAHHCPSAFLARRHGRAIGWIAGRVLVSGRGYVDMVAVATSDRRHGLGRALLLHALADLQQAGADGFTLGVQAANQGALGLYRSVGLEVEHEWRVYG